jgi:hypothetical protein
MEESGGQGGFTFPPGLCFSGAFLTSKRIMQECPLKMISCQRRISIPNHTRLLRRGSLSPIKNKDQDQWISHVSSSGPQTKWVGYPLRDRDLGQNGVKTPILRLDNLPFFWKFSDGGGSISTTSKTTSKFRCGQH